MLRLMFDENMSTGVAQALHLLDFDVQWVGKGKGGAPRKQASDEEVVAWAKFRGYVVITANYDLVLAAIAADAQFILVNPPGASLTKFETAKVVFEQWSKWEQLLCAEGHKAIRVNKSDCHPITVVEAQGIVEIAMARHADGANKKAARAIKPRQQPSANAERASALREVIAAEEG